MAVETRNAQVIWLEINLLLVCEQNMLIAEKTILNVIDLDIFGIVAWIWNS